MYVPIHPSNHQKLNLTTYFSIKLKGHFSKALLILCFTLHCAAQPPQEKGYFKKSDLVELVELDPSICLDIRYASKNNFVGKPVYEQARAFLQRPAAEALVEVNDALRLQGYGLLVFDGYRPWSVTKLFWDVTPPDKRKFVAKPSDGSRHNRGCAVDLSLVNLETGLEVQMTSAYDEMTYRSYSNYTGGTVEQRKLRDLLIKTMQSHSFEVFYNEWWHFDYHGWEDYQIQNIPFSEIK